MAIPFYVPDEDDSQVVETTSTSNTVPSTPSRPIPTPQISPIDNEMLVQAFYEALCRCSQGSPYDFPSTPPLSPFHHRNFRYSQSTLTSAASTPRNSFRNVPRRRVNSLGNYPQFRDDDDCQPREENTESASGGKKKQSKITNFVIGALKFFMDSLR